MFGLFGDDLRDPSSLTPVGGIKKGRGRPQRWALGCLFNDSIASLETSSEI